MTSKLKIAFNPEGLWDREEFRNVIKAFLVDEDKVELYVVGTTIPTSFITVAEDMGIDSDNIYTEASNAAVVTKLDDLKVRIFLSATNPLIMLVNEDSVDTVGIIVNDIVDANKSQMKYITMLQFWIDRIDRIENGVQENC